MDIFEEFYEEEYLKELAYINAENQILEQQYWEEEQEKMKRKDAKIIIEIKEHELEPMAGIAKKGV